MTTTHYSEIDGNLFGEILGSFDLRFSTEQFEGLSGYRIEVSPRDWAIIHLLYDGNSRPPQTCYLKKVGTSETGELVMMPDFSIDETLALQ